MKFTFRELTLHVYHSIAPAHIIGAINQTEELRQTILSLSANAELDFLEEYFLAGTPEAQVSRVKATGVLAIRLLDKIGNYIAELDDLCVTETEKKNCLSFYNAVAANVSGLLSFLRSRFDELSDANDHTNRVSLLQTSLSVSQLGVLLRLLVDAGIVKTESHRQLILHAVASYTTHRTTEISPDSLLNKFYKPDVAAIAIMQSHVNRMLALLKQYRQSA